MLTSLKLANFRGFEAHELPIKPLTIAVGRNNAGKSTVIEALRLVSIVSQRYRHLSYSSPPGWLDLPKRTYGARIDIRNLQIDFDTICYEYRDPPAQIEAHFKTKAKICIYIGGSQQIHAVVLDSEGNAVRNGSQAKRLNLPRVAILPQITPLSRGETVLNRDYVLGAVDSPLSSLHFRNQLRIHKDLLPEFRDTAERTWSGLQVRELSDGRGLPGDEIFLQVRNDEFVGEVCKMGHGLQMWLQCIWFLVRSKGATTLILDEPDVYMHADLQRRLLKHLKSLGVQILIATHSVEMIAEVEADEILVIERRRRHSRFANSLPAVQRIVEGVGSTQNVHLARLWSTKRFLMVEGDDLRVLKRMHDSLFPSSSVSLDMIPNLSIGGWSGWSRAIGSSLAMRNAFGESVSTYCILDRDYHGDEEIAEMSREATSKGVYLHVWKRKELENYLFDPTAIERCVRKYQPDADISADEILLQLITMSNELEEETVDAICDEIHRRDRKLSAGVAHRRARQFLKSKRSEDRGLIDVVSGKSLMHAVSKWTQIQFGTGISIALLSRELLPSEICDEMKHVLTAIEKQRAFD